ncbi:MAG: hypothetical protein A2792_19645 [Sphingomonadales bacterium RIFCSPHIGHO2_01_FULL_65_20]|nr:MAG: hypothetical protein A2792_19645 [Sphingomonadales bacterium RIFCSPHIGHO2_01_FULL_65_20]
MSWYKTGTVAINNGSTTVTGTGTAWVDNVDVGEGILLPDGRTYEITGVVSNTSLTIGRAYLGSNTSGQPYEIQPFRGRIAGLTARADNLLNSFQAVRDGIGAGLFPDGSAATPAFRFTNDQDTGIFRAGANAASLVANGVDQFTWNANGVISRKFANFLQTDLVGIAAPTLGVLPAGASALFGVNGLYGLLIGTNGATGNTWLQSQRVDGTATAYSIVLQPAGGNVGIGVAPSVWAGSFKALDIGGATFASTGNESYQGANWFFNGAVYVYKSSGHATQYIQANGQHLWFTAASGSGGSAVSFAPVLTIDASGHILPGADATQNLASASLRLNNSYFAVSPTVTSDETQKHWRGPLNAAELRAAKRIIGELGIYQWNDAVAEKGEDGARLHFGVRAQRAFAILEDEGLDWSRYAWACYDQWEEQTEPVMEEVTVPKTRKVMRPSTLIDPATGQPAMVEVDEAYEETEMRPTGETRVTLEAGDRYGVRPDQLAFWLIAAQAAIQAELEATQAILETRIAALEDA